MINTVFDISIDFHKSKGSYVYDKKTKTCYLDLCSMFSSLPLGYNHPIFDGSFESKIKTISNVRMSNNLFHSDELSDYIAKLQQVCFHQNIHFCSTGALAVESALKCSYEYSKSPSSIIVGLKNSFHGINSWGFVTDKNISSVKNRLLNYPRNNWKNIDIGEIVQFLDYSSDRISAVIIEPIQCTAGDIHLDACKLKEIEVKCKGLDICFIVDEIQTGFGSTGEYWYSRKLGLNPDIVVFGKKSQICGIMVNDKYAEAIHSKHRKLEVTFDGELIDAVRSSYVIDAIERYNLLSNVKEKSRILKTELSDLFFNYRYAGHLIGFDFKNNILRDKFVKAAYENLILVNPTGDKSVRLRPNLSFSDEEMDKLICTFKKITI